MTEQNAMLPMGKIGEVEISRLICGGNLIGGWAHSRDLMYVASLLRHYFTEEKVMDTWQTCEGHGINTIISTVDDSNRRVGILEDPTIRVLNRYRKERGGRIQWIAQCNAKYRDLITTIKDAIDHGAVGAFVQRAERYVSDGRLEELVRAISFIQENGLIAGVGCHSIEGPMAIEEAGIEVGFYFKTLNNVGYCSDTPQQTIEFMKAVDKPWIAFKVLGAGVIHPREGFRYAFESGADFINVGMFDFQIAEDADIVRDVLSHMERVRPWRG